MYRVIDKRGSGKTSRLMLLAKEHNGIFVCSNPLAMKEKALSYGLVGFDIMSYEEYYYGEKENKPIFIDELDLYLKYCDKNIKGYTLSEDD